MKRDLWLMALGATLFIASLHAHHHEWGLMVSSLGAAGLLGALVYRPRRT